MDLSIDTDTNRLLLEILLGSGLPLSDIAVVIFGESGELISVGGCTLVRSDAGSRGTGVYISQALAGINSF